MNTPNNKPKTPRSELKVVRQKWQLHSLAGLEFGLIGFTWFWLKFMCLCWVTSWLCSEGVSPHSAVSIMQVDSAMHTMTDVHIHETWKLYYLSLFIQYRFIHVHLMYHMSPQRSSIRVTWGGIWVCKALRPAALNRIVAQRRQGLWRRRFSWHFQTFFLHPDMPWPSLTIPNHFPPRVRIDISKSSACRSSSLPSKRGDPPRLPKPQQMRRPRSRCSGSAATLGTEMGDGERHGRGSREWMGGIASRTSWWKKTQKLSRSRLVIYRIV